MYILSEDKETVEKINKILDETRDMFQKTADKFFEEHPDVGEKSCENCVHHDDCICVVCEEGNTVVCDILQKHVSRKHSCKYFNKMEEN